MLRRRTDPSLALLAQIVHFADSCPNWPNVAGEGLRWIIHSLSTLGLCDHEIVEREFIVIHDLYAGHEKRVAA